MCTRYTSLSESIWSTEDSGWNSKQLGYCDYSSNSIVVNVPVAQLACLVRNHQRQWHRFHRGDSTARELRSSSVSCSSAEAKSLGRLYVGEKFCRRTGIHCSHSWRCSPVSKQCWYSSTLPFDLARSDTSLWEISQVQSDSSRVAEKEKETIEKRWWSRNDRRGEQQRQRVQFRWRRRRRRWDRRRNCRRERFICGTAIRFHGWSR